MKFWITFWTIFYLGTLAVFAGLAVVVIIKGFFDIKYMLRNLSQMHTEENSSQDEVKSEKL